MNQDNQQPELKKKSRKWLWILGGIIILIIIVAVSGGNDSGTTTNTSRQNNSVSSEQTTNQEWYKGGTLHQATIADWKVASDKNKLATSADMMAVVDNTVSMDELRTRAESLKKCIDEAVDIDETTIDESKVSEVGALCIISLGYGN